MNNWFRALVVIWLCASPCMAKGQASALALGHLDTVYSQILNEKRALWIYTPQQEPNPAMARKKFPVIYLLDGNEYFHFVTSLVRRLSEGFTHVLPEMIIVAIPNTDRLRDLTPTHITRTDTYTDSNLFRTTGGGPAFLDFLQKELFNYIDSTYPAAPHRTFIGHSLGGLMVLEAMVKRPQMFNAWLSIDPSIWYDRRTLLRESEHLLAPGSLREETGYLAIANNLPRGMDTARMKKDTTRATIDTRAIFDFTKLLRRKAGSGLQWSYRYYPDDDHGSVTQIATYDGLRYIFRDCKLPSFEHLLDSAVEADRVLKKQFAGISRQWGYAVYPPEAFTNALGYTLMQRKQFDKAQKVFQLNVDAYPQSANVYDSMGDCFRAMGKKDLAKRMYEKSISLLDSPSTRDKLLKL